MPFQRRTAVHLFPHVALALFILGSAHAALAQNVTIQARLEYALPYACGVFPGGGPFLPALPFNPIVLPNVRLLAANILLVNKITFRLRGPAGRLPPLVPLVAVAVEESECCENPAADSLDEGKLPSIAPQTLPGGILDPVSEVAEEIEREIGQPVNRDLIEVLEVSRKRCIHGAGFLMKRSRPKPVTAPSTSVAARFEAY